MFICKVLFLWNVSHTSFLSLYRDIDKTLYKDADGSKLEGGGGYRIFWAGRGVFCEDLYINEKIF